VKEIAQYTASLFSSQWNVTAAVTIFSNVKKIKK